MWSWLAAMVALWLVLLAATVRFMWPPVAPLYVGNVADFVEGVPQIVLLENDLAVYVVKLEGKMLIWDGRAPIWEGCRFVWEAPNNRFVDPCSGAKWCADGTLADVRYEQARTLDRHSTQVDEAGEIFVLPEQQVEGERPIIKMNVPNSPTWMPPDEIYYCEHLPAAEASIP